MPPIASGKSKSMSAFSKSDLGEGCSWRAPQLEDDLQLHNLVELMTVFHVSMLVRTIIKGNKTKMIMYYNNILSIFGVLTIIIPQTVARTFNFS